MPRHTTYATAARRRGTRASLVALLSASLLMTGSSSLAGDLDGLAPAATESPAPTPVVSTAAGDVRSLAVAPAAAPSASTVGQPQVCDTNRNTGKVGHFMQRSDVTEFANGNLSEGLYEGGYVHQRVELTQLKAGQNELVFTYDVRKGGKWAYDSIDSYSFTSSTVTAWTVVEGSGPDRVDTVYVTFDVPAGTTTDAFYFSAHIASELDHGPGSGAGSISGSPYHVSLSSLNCAETGQKDNQISAADVQAGHVTVTKVADPADGTNFVFGLGDVDEAISFVLDDGADADEHGSTVTYRVAPGQWTVSELDIPRGWNLTDLTCTGATATYTGASATFAVSDDQTVSCTFANTKSVYGDLGVAATAVPSYALDYDWAVEKAVRGSDRQEVPAGQDATFTYDVTVTPTAGSATAPAVRGTITVTNPNPVDVHGVSVVATLPGATCTVHGAEGAVSILVGPPMVFAYTCELAEVAPTTAGTVAVAVTWSAQDVYGTSGSAQTGAAFDFADAQVYVSDGSVVVTDSHVDLTGYDDGTQVGNRVHAENGPVTFTYDRAWPGVPGTCTSYDNTATVAGSTVARIASGSGVSASSTETVEVCAGADLAAAKTVDVAHTRTYAWTIDKSADRSAIDVDATTGTATVDYTVEVVPDGYTDSGWAMSGSITVTNPNDWQDVVATVSDATTLGGGAVCTVNGTDVRPDAPGLQVSVPRDATLVLDYSCAFTGPPSYTGVNAATVTWDATSHATPQSAAGARVDIDEADWARTDVNETVTVRDDKTDPAQPVELGTVSWADGVREFTYSLPLAGARGECVEHTNRAWIAETGQEDAWTVEACWPTPGITVAKLAWDVADGPITALTAELPAGSALVAGTSVTWTYLVTNTGTSQLDDIDVVDTYTTTGGDVGQVTVTCPATSLAAGASMTCTGSGPVGAGAYGLGAQQP